MSRDFVQALWEKLGGEGPAPWHANQPADEVVKAIYALTGADGITIDVVDWHGGTLRWEVTLRGEFYEWPVVVAPTLVEALLWSVEAKPKPLRPGAGARQ